MNEGKSKMQPWQLVLILILVLAFFGGLYVMNQAITTKLDSISAAIEANTAIVRLTSQGVGNKVDQISSAAVQPAPAAAVQEAPAVDTDAAKPAEEGEGKKEAKEAEE